MYFNENNNFFHGIMFHHFHDNEIHKKGQGSIDKNDFYKMINFIGRNNILDADVFVEKFKNDKLKETNVCLTFDDGLKSQIDIALPVLEDLKIKCFFFVHTGIFDDTPDYLELFRYFRLNYFDSVDEFYSIFYQVLDKDLMPFFKKYEKKIKTTKINYSFYSIEDIKFRLVRDLYLTKSYYEEIMFLMFKKKNFNHKEHLKKIFFQKDDLIRLDSLRHLVGLHSHNHPTLLEKLDYDAQHDEYEKNLLSISKILNKPKNQIKHMSHPCGSYDKNTLKILKKLGIELGFRDLMSIDPEKGMNKVNNSFVEIARENHATIYKKMNL